MRLGDWSLNVVFASLGAVLGISGIIAVGPLHANYSTPGNLRWVNLGSAAVVNYDQTANVSPMNPNAVDWSIDLVYYGNAEVDKVKNILKNTGRFRTSGTTMYGQVHEGPNLYSDADSGVKNDIPGCATDINIHQRIYARPTVDVVYSNTHGFVVWATSHHDVHEGCSDEWFGDSEWAENQFGTEYQNLGYTICRDCWWYSNYEPFSTPSRLSDPKHHWDNNGWATAIYVP
jgi:hypothetical protein